MKIFSYSVGFPCTLLTVSFAETSRYLLVNILEINICLGKKRRQDFDRGAPVLFGQSDLIFVVTLN